MKKLKLEVQKRKTLGKKVKKLRAESILPANIYGKKVKSTAVEVDLKAFQNTYQEAGETGVVNLKIKGETKTRPILIHNVQLHPVTDWPLHADFHQISLKEKTMVSVPVELIGESPAEKSGSGILITLHSELEVEALPTDLPEKLEININQLENIDDAVRVKDIKVDTKKIKILADENEIVVRIAPPEKEEAVEKPQPEAEASKEEKKEEEENGEKESAEKESAEKQ